MRSDTPAVKRVKDGASGSRHDAVIVGGGPTGLMLASELALAGVDVALIERRLDQGVLGTRALGLLPRAVETLDLRGIGDRFVAAGQTYPELNFHVQLDVSQFPTRRNYLLGLPQDEIEKLLAEWADSLPITFYRGQTAAALTQDRESVCIKLETGAELKSSYAVGCDGGRSLVRKLVGIAFEGWPASTSWVMAEVRTSSEPQWGFHVDTAGQQHAIVQADTPGFARLVLVEPGADLTREPTLDEVKRALTNAFGTDFGVHSPIWISRFTDAARQASRYRQGRVLLAGDAAHVHAPLGGQGLGIGLQDAVNLGWKLGQVIKGMSPDCLLDTYEKERRPVAARVLQNTMALSALRRPDPHSKALGRYFAELLELPEPRALMTAEVSGLGTAYDLGEGHPLSGRRMPDVELIVDAQNTHAYRYLHNARPVLFNFGPAVDDWSCAAIPNQYVQVVNASMVGELELPLEGPIDAPPALLVRPDGYIAWAGALDDRSLDEAVAFWFDNVAG